MQLRIDPEFESRIPPLTDDEFQQLEENILADGVIISPIVVWEGVVIDGHNRFRIVEKHPHISFTTCERQFENRYEALAWICKNQLGRRNLTFQQKKYLIGKQYDSEKASHGGDRKSEEVISSGLFVHLIADPLSTAHGKGTLIGFSRNHEISGGNDTFYIIVGCLHSGISPFSI